MVYIQGLTYLALFPLTPSTTTLLVLIWLKPHWPLHVASSQLLTASGPVVAIPPPLPPGDPQA